MVRAFAVLALLAVGATPASVDEMRLLSPSFGYAVEGARTVRVLVNGHLKTVTPPLGTRFIEDVDFVDARRGWVAQYDCGRAAVFLFRTTNGGRSWQPLGRPGSHSCGGGPTYLSFVDATHGWLEPLSPNGPEGTLRRTQDGGKTWKTVSRHLPCLRRARFTSRTVGWIARCGNALFRTRDAGHTWTKALGTRSQRRQFDLPRLSGASGAAASVGSGSVRFFVTGDGGFSWAAAGSRRVFPCADNVFYPSFFPEGIVNASVWWVVNQGRVSITTDAGRHWRTTRAKGLPRNGCAVREVSAVDARRAWLVARVQDAKLLFATSNGGRTWRKLA